jgi:L-rhamnose mutarotase
MPLREMASAPIASCLRGTYTCWRIEAEARQLLVEEVNRRWQAFMAPFFEIPPGSRPDQMMVELVEVFHID